jgi:hypothetical protein
MAAASAFGVLTLPVKAQSLPGYGSITLNAGSNPTSAKVADLDGDGLNDIAVVNQQGSLQLFFNAGGGSFQQVSTMWHSEIGTMAAAVRIMESVSRTTRSLCVSNPGPTAASTHPAAAKATPAQHWAVCSSSVAHRRT